MLTTHAKPLYPLDVDNIKADQPSQSKQNSEEIVKASLKKEFPYDFESSKLGKRIDFK